MIISQITKMKKILKISKIKTIKITANYMLKIFQPVGIYLVLILFFLNLAIWDLLTLLMGVNNLDMLF